MSTFTLPPSIAELIKARNVVRDHYGQVLRRQGSEVELKFTLDGNLVGDLGEALAAELFGVRLAETKSTEGIDGHAPDGRTVQVKATGTKGGPAFRPTETRADHLLFFCLDFENGTGEVAYNGPEKNVTRYLPVGLTKQRCVSRPRIRIANDSVTQAERLARID
ncbi:DUF6998 domain-containing protein [Sphingobium yanoikuyae]